MPDVGIDSSIYGRLNQGQSNAFGNMSPAQLLDLYRTSQDLNAQAAIGEAYSRNIDPNTGMLNAANAARDIAANPAAHWRAPEALKNITAQNAAQFEIGAARNGVIVSGLGALADKPGVTKADVANLLPTIARNTSIPTGILTSYLNDLPEGGPELRDRLQSFRNIAAGAAATAARTQGPPDITGAPTSIPMGAAGYAGAIPVGLPPGQEAAAGSAAGASNELHTAAEGTPQQLAMLQNLRDLSKRATSGPTADLEKSVNQFTQRWGGMGVSLTADQLASTEEFEKIAHQLASQQAASAHATDAYLTNAYGANPNIKLSRLGRDGIINMLIGNAKIPAIKRDAWLRYQSGAVDGQRHAANEYYQWSAEFNKHLDPRVFQFAEMNRDQQKNFLSMLGEKAGGELEQHLHDAIQRGWITPPNGR